MRNGKNFVAAVVSLACVVALGACAQIPTSGAVRVGTADVDQQVDIAMLPQGPNLGADPRSIVSGFLGAAVAATTSPKEFQTAREFLTNDVAVKWDPEASVRVVREPPVPKPLESTVEIEDAETVKVAVRATAIATLDSAGAYTEVSDPRELDYKFTLTRSGGEWRISALDNGVLVPANLFANQYRATRLFFPAEDDMESLVPDLRWFPRQYWRRMAVEELLAGPPEWLQGATQSLVPDGTQLASPSISEADDGKPVAVRLTEQIGKAPAAQRSVIAEQISATLSEGAGRPVSIDLFNETSRLAVEDADVDLPATTAQPMALKDGQLHLIDDGRVVEHELPVDLSGIDPTALAVSPVTTPIVVRDGTDRIVSISPDSESGPVPMLEGPDLAAPSIDNLGTTWTSGSDGELRVYTAALEEFTVKPDWLKGRKVVSVSVAPEGSRIAIVSKTPTGTQVQVAGIVRDNEGTPVDLAKTPLAVGAPVDDVVEARWSGLTSLALLTRDSEGNSGIWTAGVGGQAGTGGQSTKLSGLTDVAQMAAGVTDEGILVITEDGDLEHEETGVWQPLAEDVDLVAYPG
ncbi:GerMN domain-containing protein [Promicromonospora sp. NPDC023987]|uniref:GerMN domain-containing protein n=1 Tax=Promicromonospora sp. NPDC023987 TaxID=3155360 RepID=UPI0033FC88CD